jgi:hypothetical protein
MMPTRDRFGRRFHAIWRSQRGVGLGEILVLAALVAAGIAALAPIVTKKAPSLQAGFNEILPCHRIINAAVAGLQYNYGDHKDPDNPDSPFIGFPPGLQVPANDPAVVAIKSCKTKLDSFNESIKTGNFRALEEIGKQIDSVSTIIGTCKFPDDFKLAAGTAGTEYSDLVLALIPFASGVQATGSAVATGAAAGSGGMKSSGDQNTAWTGQIKIPASASVDAAGGTSSVRVTAKTAALVRKASDGSCPGASIQDGKYCVQIAQADGKCPPGQQLEDGRCYASCTTVDSREINWKAPPPAKAVSFVVSPNQIDKGSTAPVTLLWVVNNAESISVNQGVGDFPSDPSKANVQGRVVLNPPPQSSTTWTLLALGIQGRTTDSKAATLVVKEPDAEAAVSLTSPRPNEQILNFSVPVSGVVRPVPDAAHRTAQILVNGVGFVTTIKADGTFEAVAPLQNTIGASDLIVFGPPAVAVTQCGPAAAPISIGAFTQNGVKNLVRVVVPLGNDRSVSTSVTVEHVVSVHSFQVVWGGGCGAAPSQNNSLGFVIRDGEPSTPVGSVLCGFSKPIHCSDTARITIATSAGTKVVNEAWSANINSCD